MIPAHDGRLAAATPAEWPYQVAARVSLRNVNCVHRCGTLRIVLRFSR